jgi:3-isopropylmalate/(R)-2-methylmalate dehydratase small subunit
MADFQWKLRGRCYKLGHDVPHAGGVIPNSFITGRFFDPKDLVPNLFAETLGLGLVCESMPFLAYRACIGVGLRTMTDCPSVTDLCDTGDDLEVDFSTGLFVNRTRNLTREYPPLPETLLELVRLGGNAGWLKNWWESRHQKAASGS